MLTAEQNRVEYQKCADHARGRIAESEVGLLQDAPYDPQSPYHDFNQVVVPPNLTYPAEGLRFMGELILNDFDVSSLAHGTQKFDEVVASLTPSVEPIAEAVRKGDTRLAVITGHPTRLEPAVAMFAVQAAIARNPEEHDALRKKAALIVSRYLACMNVNEGRLTGDATKGFENVLRIASELGSVGLSYPNTESGRGIRSEISAQSNKQMKQFIAERPKGSVIALAANGTWEKTAEDTGVKHIVGVTNGTVGLLSGYDVLPIASNLEAPSPFAVGGAIIPAAQVTPDAIHDAMQWMAATRNDHGLASHYVDPRHESA